MVTALITGITGQDGAYLAKLLLSKDYEVYGFASRRVNQTYENLDYLGITDQVKIIFGDMTDHSSIANAIKTSNPNEQHLDQDHHTVLLKYLLIIPW